MALKPQRQIQDGRVGTGTGSDIALRLPGQGANAVPAAIRQWFGIYQQELHRTSQKLWSAAGIHHSLQPGAKRDGGAGNPHLEGSMRTPPPV